MSNHDRVIQVLADVLNLQPADIPADATRADLPAWDSLQHLSVIMAVEQEFSISIDFDDVISVNGLPDLLRLVERAA